ncbi:MAG: hypothetical protein U0930_06380 [Pirellulales bacterium]
MQSGRKIALVCPMHHIARNSFPTANRMKNTHRYALLVVPPALLLILGLAIACNLPCKSLVVYSMDRSQGHIEFQGNPTPRYCPGYQLDLNTKQIRFVGNLPFLPAERFRSSDGRFIVEKAIGPEGTLRQKNPDGTWELQTFTKSTADNQVFVAAYDLVGVIRGTSINVINTREKNSQKIEVPSGWRIHHSFPTQNGNSLVFLISRGKAVHENFEFKLIEVDQQLNRKEKWHLDFRDCSSFVSENCLYRIVFNSPKSQQSGESVKGLLESYDLETGELASSVELPGEFRDNRGNTSDKYARISRNLIFVDNGSRIFNLHTLKEIKLSDPRLRVSRSNRDGSVLMCSSGDYLDPNLHLIDGLTQKKIAHFSPSDTSIAYRGNLIISVSDRFGGTIRIADMDSGKVVYDRSPFAWVLWIVPFFIWGIVAWSSFAVRALERHDARWAWFVALVTLTITVTPCAIYLNYWNPSFIPYSQGLLASTPFLPAVAASCLWLVLGTEPLRWRILPLSLLLIGSVLSARLQHLSSMRLLHECFQVIVGFVPICLVMRWRKIIPTQQIGSRHQVTTRDYFVMSALLAGLLVAAGNFEVYVKGSSFYNLNSASLAFFGAVQFLLCLALFLSLKKAHRTILCLALLMALTLCFDFEYHWINIVDIQVVWLRETIRVARAALITGVLSMVYLPCAIHLVLARDKSASNPVVQSGLS